MPWSSCTGVDCWVRSGQAVGLRKHVLGVRFQIALDAAVPVQGARDEINGLVDSLIGLGATEPQEAAAGLAEAFATQAGNAEIVIGPFEEIECQAVRADASTRSRRATSDCFSPWRNNRKP